jgi:CRISPR-associated protein Cmx8
MKDLLLRRPWEFFVRSEKTPRGLPWFSADASAHFWQLEDAFQKKVAAMTIEKDAVSPPESRSLDILIFRLVRKYVTAKVTDKYGLKWDDVKRAKDDPVSELPEEYRKARGKVVEDVFLAMRSRREKDFVDYFTSTICSVSQFLPEDDYGTVARALLNKSDDVKTLALLALSANS